MSEAEPAMTTDERMYLFETVMLALLEEATHDPARFERLSKILQAKVESVEGKAGDCHVSRELKTLQEYVRRNYQERSNAQNREAASRLRALGFGKKPN